MSIPQWFFIIPVGEGAKRRGMEGPEGAKRSRIKVRNGQREVRLRGEGAKRSRIIVGNGQREVGLNGEGEKRSRIKGGRGKEN